MAKNAKYYAKIGGSWEQQNFETTATQVSLTNQGVGLLNNRTTVESALEHIHDLFGASAGFATLDGTGKLQPTQLPASVAGGMRFKGVLTSATYTFDNIIGTGSNQISIQGEYLVAVQNIIITNSGSSITGSLVGVPNNATGDEEDHTLPISLEKGDWIVLTADSTSSAASVAIINNTYRDANDSSKGIVTLSAYADGDTYSALTSGTDVITELQLKNATIDNIGTGATNFAAGNHTHTQYAPKAGATFTGSVILGDGDTNHPDLILNYVDDNAGASGSASEDITFRYVEITSGTQSNKSLNVTSGGLLQFDGNNIANASNWNTTSIGIPEIFVSTSTPSGGKNGDVWIEYTA